MTRRGLYSLGLGVSLTVVGGAFFATLARCGGRDSVPPRTAEQPAPAPPWSAALPGAVSPAGTVPVGVAIQCDAASHRISPLIYGIAEQPMHHDAAQWQLGATARRWGGNHTSLYNWQLGNAWNTGKDWFFKNVDFDGKAGPAYQRFIEEDRAHGLATALTIPIIGWAAKDTSSYSFPVSVYGPQQATAPENPDIGNGVSPSGKPLTPGSPERTSVVMPPESIGRWVSAIRAADGARGVQMYILGNEPMLWNETHRNVHPKPTSYDELLSRTIAYASAVRKADPGAVIAGPALWGWPAYFGSAVDHDAQPRHPDRDRHGGTPLLPWWLGQIAAHEKSNGQRLLDVVDVHFYPQGEGMGLGKSGETDPDTAARRIRSVRALWDPQYRDESWIGEPIELIPRLKAWIAEKHPGLGISIGEYNFGAEKDMSGGLAVAEALGRFGQQGIRAAFYWDYPPLGSPAYFAFLAYRNFDGKGGRFLDYSVPATSDDQRLSVFASRSADGKHLVIVLLDLDPSTAIAASLDATGCGRVSRQRRFVYRRGAPGFAPATPASRKGALELALPAYSMTVLDLQLLPGT